MKTTNPNPKVSIETNFSNNLINYKGRLGTFTTLLGFFILLSFLTFLYQTPNLSPLEIIKSISTTKTTTLATVPTSPTDDVLPKPTTLATVPTSPTDVALPKPTTIATEPTIASPVATETTSAAATAPATIITMSGNLANTSAYTIYNSQPGTDPELPSQYNTTYEKLSENESGRECNVFDGKWVYDPKGSPFYKNRKCPFLSDQVSCRRNGRPEFEYEKWRWEAKDCHIPRWNGKEMLERLRGKRVTVVGDSINRNQWESLSCLLYSSIPRNRAEVDVKSDVYKVFKAKDYNCTIEFFWSPFLVDLNDKNINNDRVLKIDSLVPSASQWRGADIMIFNTGFWWTHTGKMQTWDCYEHHGKLVKDMDVETAFPIAMKTWANWIDLNVDPAKTTVFFRSSSVRHNGKQWCYNQTQPINDDSYRTSFPKFIAETVVKTISEMQTPTKYLNITKLSEYRKDAHPTIYTSRRGKLLTMEQRAKPELNADCSHWCLPGVPDTWNSLLFTSLFFKLFPTI